eukprot:TRINITY_DN5456_c0_g1_i1.p1 TRINITY_DN5456_c0_g1~~TRINITY_DN5456_c0_g1_i1.p1  ORF type:complete len:477 (-),score=109.70 TRINITY_DN5456_c0_g1_i1:660-2048(-)
MAAQKAGNFAAPGSACLQEVQKPGDACEPIKEVDVESSPKCEKAEDVRKKWRAQDPSQYVLIVGVVLAGCAGFVNATAFLTCGGFVSHVTGTTSKLGLALEGYYTEDGQVARVLESLFLLVSFLVGAVLCGMLVSRNEVHFGTSAYGIALCVNSVLLLVAVGIFDITTPSGWPVYFQAKWLALYLQSAACGLQNGMCTAHFGAVVRTTHLTGLTTDSGLTIGRLLSILIRARCNKRNFRKLDWAEVNVDLKKLLVFASLFAGYVLGVCSGASLSAVLSIHALFIPAFITGCGGLTYSVLKANCLEAFQRAEAEKLAQNLEEAEEIFARAIDQIGDWKESSPKGGAASAELEELDGEVGKALDLLHNMEAALQNRSKNAYLERSISERSLGSIMSRKLSGQSDAANTSINRINSNPRLDVKRMNSNPTLDVKRVSSKPTLLARLHAPHQGAVAKVMSPELYHV